MNRTRTSAVGAFGGRDQRSQLDPVLIGNAALAGQFVRDAINKRDHLDVVVIGDSNAVFNDSAGSRGYAGGFVDYIVTASSYIYTTGQFYAGGTSTTYPSNGGPAAVKYFESSLVARNGYLSPGVNGGYWYAGSVTGYPNEGSGDPGADIPASYVRPYFYNQGTNKLALGTQGTNPHAQCAYFHNTTGGSNSYGGSWVKLYKNQDAAKVLASTDAVTYRTYHGKIPGAGATAKYTAWVYNDTGGTGTPAAQTAVSMTNAGTETVISYDDRDCAARADANIIAGTFNSNNTSTGTIGPMAVFFHTFFKKNSPGFGVNVMHFGGGGTTTQIASSFANSTFGCGLATQKLYFQCLRQTQISAGGKGRVLVFINMGTNSSADGPTYMKDTALLVSQLKTAWGQTGAPADDLVFVLTATAPWSSYDAVSASAGAKALASTEANVIAYNIGTDLGYTQSALSAGSLYAGGSSTPQAHLAVGGYSGIVTALMNSLKTL